MLVHMPIGLVLLVGLLELLARSRRFRNANTNAGIILALAAPVSLLAVVCGWLLSLGGGYEPRLLQWHKWVGIATAAGCLIAGLLYGLDLKKPYRWCLAGTVLLLAVASHFGGSLTHGSDYLTRYAPASLRTLLAGKPRPQPVAIRQDPAELPTFAALVQPILEQNCVACHGPEKSKGGLRLDSFEALLKGSKSGPVLVAAKAEESELLKRLRLPLQNEDHMPPDGKPQPNADDIALLEWWISAGAPAQAKVRELKPPATILALLARRFGGGSGMENVTAPKPFKEVQPLAARLAEELNIAITPLSPQEAWLQCNASIAGTNFSDAELAKLGAVGPNLRWLDLGGTGITDKGLEQLAQAMPNLARLHLERTSVSDEALAKLQGLQQLEYLNLYGTTTTDAALEPLRQLPRLKQLYLWQTKVTPVAVKEFVDARTDHQQLQRWQEEIERLQSQIRQARLVVELGLPAVTASATNAHPVNTNCPVSDKPIDPAKTLVHEGALVAFCCDDCRAKFQQDPKPYLAKLGLGTNNSPALAPR